MQQLVWAMSAVPCVHQTDLIVSVWPMFIWNALNVEEATLCSFACLGAKECFSTVYSLLIWRLDTQMLLLNPLVANLHVECKIFYRSELCHNQAWQTVVNCTRFCEMWAFHQLECSELCSGLNWCCFWQVLIFLALSCYCLFSTSTRPPYFSARMLLLKDCKDVVEGWKAGGFVFLLSCKSICVTDCMNLLNFSGAIQCTGWGSGDAFVMEPICHYPWYRWHCWDTSQQHVCFALNQLYGNFSFPDWLAAVLMILLVWPLYLYRSSWEELEFSVPSCIWLEVGDYCVLGMVSVDMSSNRVTTTTTMSVQDMETMEV